MFHFDVLIALTKTSSKEEFAHPMIPDISVDQDRLLDIIKPRYLWNSLYFAII